MLAHSNAPIGATLLLAHTETGVGKSIRDDIGPQREYLREQGIHEYIVYRQSSGNKKSIDAYFVYADNVYLFKSPEDKITALFPQLMEYVK